MVHTNLAAYGFIFNAFAAALLWAIPRLTGERVLSDRLGWIVFTAWQAVIAATVIGIVAGYAQAVEWGETPIVVDPFVVVGFVLFVVNMMTPILRTKERALYVSLWYFLAMMAWTGLVYLMGNYLPQFFVPGAAGAAIGGLFIHDLVGLFVTPVGWGMMYYFVPVILKKPVWSHALSLVGFWGLAFFYPLNGVHHFLWSPIPMYAQYGAVVSTIAVEVVVTTVIVNFFATLRGSAGALRTSVPLRWFYTGMVFYGVTCLQCAVQVTLTVQEIIHFTDWVVGHAHLVMFGVFGSWIMGFATELWPRVVRREWAKPALNEWHYWLTTIGTVLMFIDLMAAGLVQGFLWKGLAPWEDSLLASIPFWWVRTFSGLLIIAGTACFVWNLALTRREPAGARAPEAVAVPA
jgi:cytochrome c oxidase cbb3-type subunit 1